MSDKDTNQADASDALPADLQAEADALMLEGLDGPGTIPGNVASDADAPAVDTGEMIGALLLITFNNVLAPKRGAHWGISQAESESLGQAYGVVIDKYFPDLGTGPELTAVLVSVAIFGPRIAQDVAIAKAPPEEEPKPDGDADNGE